MRNALLICGACVLLLAALWWWPRGASQPALEPATATPAPQPPTPLPGAEAPAASPPAPAAALSARQLTARALHTFERDPSAALADIALADQLDGAHDELRRAVEIKALVRLGQVGHARALTEAFYRTFPGSDQRAQLERLTGSHPRPHGP